MKNIYLLICVLCSLFVKSQTIFWAEGFGNGTNCATDQGFLLGNYNDVLGNWSPNTTLGVNNTYANIWYVSETEGGRNVGACGKKCLDSAGLVNRTMHIGSVAGSPNSAFCPTGDCGAIYDPGIGTNQVTTDIRAESPTISCLGKTGITLQFDYILRGDSGSVHDYLTVWYYDGATWTQQGGKVVPTLTCNITTPIDTEGIWATLIYPLPASANNNGAVRIGFRWINNDDGKGSTPSAAIDNITLSATTSTVTATTLSVSIIPPSTNTVYCTNTPYNFTGNANPGPITFYNWTSVSTTTLNANFNPTPAWQNGEAITFPLPGTYSITLHCNSLYNGTNDTTYIVTVVQTPTISVTPPNPFVCSGGTTGVDLYAAGALTYTWTNAPTTIPVTYTNVNGDTVNANPQSLTPPQVFTYSVTGTAADGCLSNQVVVTVTVIPIPTPYFVAQPDTICVGQHTTLSVDSMPIITTYTWSENPNGHGGLGTFSGPYAQATPIYSNPSNLQLDTTVSYQVLINVPGCPPYNPHTYNVVVSPLPHVTVTSDTIDNCNMMGDTLKAITVPTTGVTLWWVPKGSSTTLTPYSGNTNEAIVNPTGPKQYYVTPVNEFGCAGKRDSVMVLIGDTTSAAIASEYSIICFGQNDVLTAIKPQNPPLPPNTTPYHYSWGALSGGPANIISTSVSGDTILVAPTINTIYTVTVSGVCVKHNVAQASIQVNQCTTPIPVLTLSTHTVCVGHCITYKDSTQYTSTKPLTYTFVFVGADAPHGHIYPPAGNSSVSGDTLFYTTTGSAPLNPIKVCYYVNSALNENDPAHGVFGYYPVTEIVMNGIGQDSTLIDSIQVYNGPRADANGHQILTIDQGNTATLCSTGSTTVTVTTYSWTQQPDSSSISCPTCPCTVVTPTATSQFTLTLTDASGCTSSDTVSVIVDIICKDIFVANAFSPNGDGLNDVLHVKTNCPMTNMSFKIFDRWGELIFQSTDESVGWDGTYKNKPMDVGVFMYTVDGFLNNGKEAKKKGNVTLLR